LAQAAWATIWSCCWPETWGSARGGALTWAKTHAGPVDPTVHLRPSHLSRPMPALHGPQGSNRLARRHGVQACGNPILAWPGRRDEAGRYPSNISGGIIGRCDPASRLGRIITRTSAARSGPASTGSMRSPPAWRARQYPLAQQPASAASSFPSAPEAECIGKARPRRALRGSREGLIAPTRRLPWPVRAARQGAAHNPYDVPHPADVIDRTETLTAVRSIGPYVDKGYQGHDAQIPVVLHLWPERGVFGVIQVHELLRPLQHLSHHRTLESRGSSRIAATSRPRRRCLQRLYLSAVGHTFRRIRACSENLVACSCSSLSRGLTRPPPSMRLLNSTTGVRKRWPSYPTGLLPHVA